jgi:hypothetical protein
MPPRRIGGDSSEEEAFSSDDGIGRKSKAKVKASGAAKDKGKSKEASRSLYSFYLERLLMNRISVCQ